MWICYAASEDVPAPKAGPGVPEKHAVRPGAAARNRFARTESTAGIGYRRCAEAPRALQVLLAFRAGKTAQRISQTFSSAGWFLIVILLPSSRVIQPCRRK